MSNLPIAAILARNAVEGQFEERPAKRPARDGGLQESRISSVVQPTPGAARQSARGQARLAAARALRGLADRLEPGRLSPGTAQQAHPVAHRDSAC